MKKLILATSGAAFLLSGCVALEDMASGTTGVPGSNLPENVRAIAAPYQDLSDVRVNESDGCYVYRYRGPVETTYLPLRNTKGQPICIKKAAPQINEA